MKTSIMLKNRMMKVKQKFTQRQIIDDSRLFHIYFYNYQVQSKNAINIKKNKKIVNSKYYNSLINIDNIHIIMCCTFCPKGSLLFYKLIFILQMHISFTLKD